MAIEKPISTIRKAIEGSAEKIASKESLIKPEQRHYDQIFSIYKQMRDVSPELFEKLVIAAAKGKKLKDEIGPELEKVFNQVWNELAKAHQAEIDKSIEKSSEEFINEMHRITTMATKDPRIVAAFSGKEDALNKCIDYSIQTITEISL